MFSVECVLFLAPHMWVSKQNPHLTGILFCK